MRSSKTASVALFTGFIALVQLLFLCPSFAALVEPSGGHDSCCQIGGRVSPNPVFSDDIYHTHPAGKWMVDYKVMHMEMRGMRDGTRNVDVREVIPMAGTQYGYMMAPTRMTMDMHMLMVMYGVNDRLTLMSMTPYLRNKMEMLMNMGMRDVEEPTMGTSGLGDIELRGIYKIDGPWVGSLGLSLPSGATKEEFNTMGMRFRQPYDMQLGSGTYDLKPAMTYSAYSTDGKLNWGAQAQYTYRTSKNSNDYQLGDNLKVTTWLQRTFGHVTPSVRLAYSDTGRIRGEDPQIRKLRDPVMGAPMPDADPANYGGRRLDSLLGVSCAMGRLSFGVEGGVPLYENLNGLQLKTKWVLSGSARVMF